MEPKCLPIPESTRAGPGGSSILKGRENAFLASQSRVSAGPGYAFDLLGDPREVTALQSVGLRAGRRPYCKGLGREKVGLGEGAEF